MVHLWYTNRDVLNNFKILIFNYHFNISTFDLCIVTSIRTYINNNICIICFSNNLTVILNM